MKLRIMGSFLLWITRSNIAAIALAPFGIYFKNQYYFNDLFTVNHEKIHWRQQLEMLIIFFYFWYLIEWFIKIFFYGKQAYMNISFERESYANENNLDYLKTRKWYSWMKYIFKH